MKVFIVAKSKRHTRIYYYFNKAFQRLGHQSYWIKYLKLKSYLGDRMATALVAGLMRLTKPDLLFFSRIRYFPVAFEESEAANAGGDVF